MVKTVRGMMVTSPSFTMGIEEEYLLVHTDTLALAEAPQQMMDDCVAEMGSQVSPEFLRCQVEIGTKVCQTITEAREDLKRLRSTGDSINPQPVTRNP